MEKLKELLGEDLYKQVETKLGTDKKYFFDEGDFILKSRFDEVYNQSKELKQQVSDRDKQINDLSIKAKGHDELTKQIEDLKAANEKATKEYEAKILAREKDYALENELRNAKVKNSKALKALLDHDKIIFKDGAFTGLKEQLEAVKKSDAYLFDDVTPGVPGRAGAQPNPLGNPTIQPNPGASAQVNSKFWNRHKQFTN